MRAESPVHFVESVRRAPRHPPRPRHGGAARPADVLVAVRRGAACRCRPRTASGWPRSWPRVPARADHADRRSARAHPVPPAGGQGLPPRRRSPRSSRSSGAITVRLIDSWIDRGSIEFVARLRCAAARRGHRPRPERSRRPARRLQALVRRLDRRHRHQPVDRGTHAGRARRQRVPALLRRAARAASNRAARRPADQPAERARRPTTTPR